MTKSKSFTLDQDVIEFLDYFKGKYKIPKSVIVNHLLKYFKEKQKDLLEIIVGD